MKYFDENETALCGPSSFAARFARVKEILPAAFVIALFEPVEIAGEIR
jgi:hypothetical protein